MGKRKGCVQCRCSAVWMEEDGERERKEAALFLILFLLVARHPSSNGVLEQCNDACVFSYKITFVITISAPLGRGPRSEGRDGASGARETQRLPRQVPQYWQGVECSERAAVLQPAGWR